MITIKMLRDDEGLIRLRAADAAPRTSKPVNAITGYPSVKTATEEQLLPTQARHYTHPKENLSARPAHKTRGSDRRRGQDRRQENKAVLLDTRSAYPRRTQDRRRSTTLSPATSNTPRRNRSSQKTSIQRLGINLYT